MRELALVWPTRAERWRKPAFVAVSLGLHVLVFGLLGLRTLGLGGVASEAPPILYVEIEPRPLLAGEVARVRPPSARPETETAPLSGAPTAPTAEPFRNPEDEDELALPSPRSGAAGAPAPPAEVGTAPWQVRPETLGDRVGRGLRPRPAGCASPSLLTAAERAVCDDRFGQRAAAAAPIDDTNASPFAREGARRLADYEARRRPLAGGTGVVGPQDGPGSNFGTGVAGAHLDPSFRPDSTRNIRTDRRDGPR